jgi:hypothetical protein
MQVHVANTLHLAEHGNRWDTADRPFSGTGLVISVFRCRLQILYPRQSIRPYTLMPLAEVLRGNSLPVGTGVAFTSIVLAFSHLA